MRFSELWKRCWHRKSFVAGACMVALMLLLMLAGFFWMPYDPDAMELTTYKSVVRIIFSRPPFGN